MRFILPFGTDLNLYNFPLFFTSYTLLFMSLLLSMFYCVGLRIFAASWLCGGRMRLSFPCIFNLEAHPVPDTCQQLFCRVPLAKQKQQQQWQQLLNRLYIYLLFLISPVFCYSSCFCPLFKLANVLSPFLDAFLTVFLLEFNLLVHRFFFYLCLRCAVLLGRSKCMHYRQTFIHYNRQ